MDKQNQNLLVTVGTLTGLIVGLLIGALMGRFL